MPKDLDNVRPDLAVDDERYSFTANAETLTDGFLCLTFCRKPPDDRYVSVSQFGAPMPLATQNQFWMEL